MSNLSFLELYKLYNKEFRSVPEIARMFKCSENKVNYWLAKHKIQKRTISAAIYIKHNPKGDPFVFNRPKTAQDEKLFGLGIGLYWGEGNKANKNTVRLGNSDPFLLEIFIKFLIKFFNINKDDLRFHFHIFSDIDIKEAQDYWIRKLKIKKWQLYKPMITKTGALGTYRNKSSFGVLTVYYGNTKLRNLLVSLIKRIPRMLASGQP